MDVPCTSKNGMLQLSPSKLDPMSQGPIWNLVHDMFTSLNGYKTSWWLNHPSEKYARQNGKSSQVGVKIKNIWNHHPENIHIVPEWIFKPFQKKRRMFDWKRPRVFFDARKNDALVVIIFNFIHTIKTIFGLSTKKHQTKASSPSLNNSQVLAKGSLVPNEQWKKNSYTFHYTGWLMTGSLCHGLWNNLHMTG